VLAIEHATVITMDGASVLRDHTILADDQRVAWVGPAAQASIPAGARRIDGRGRYAMPGLADMHVHPTAEVDLLLLLRYGVTTIRNMAGMPRHLGWRESVARDELLAPSIYTVSPIVDGSPTMRLGAVPIQTEAEADVAVRRVRAQGYSAVKVYDHLSRRGYDAVIAAARAQDIPVVGHIPFTVGLDRALAARQRSIEHAYGYVEAMQPPGSPLRECTLEPSAARQALADAQYEIDAPRIAELADATTAAGTWNCPTMMIRRRHEQRIDDLASRPETRYVDAITMERWRQFKLTYPYDLRHKTVELEIMRRLVHALHARGRGLLIGTDAPMHYLVYGASLHEELEQFVSAGLSPHETLTIATHDAAAFLGEDDTWGTIAQGRRADLLLLDADPLADIANARRIAGVVLRGRWLEPSAIDERLERAVARRDAHYSDAAAPREESGATRFLVSWGNHRLGTESLTTAANGSRGRVVHARARLTAATGRGFDEGDEGGYRSELVFDDDGIAQSATNEAVTVDGRLRTELRRDGSRVLVRSEGGFAADAAEFNDVSETTLLGRADAAFYVELARRVRSLSPGGRTAIDLLGPGIPPDAAVLVTHVEVERVGTDFAFTALRPNGRSSGVLRLDPSGELAEVETGGRPSEISQREGRPRKTAAQPPSLVLRRESDPTPR
jgi:hypothetical protein